MFLFRYVYYMLFLVNLFANILGIFCAVNF